MTSAVADFIAPTVPVGTSVGKYKSYDEKHRFRIPDTRRSLGGGATVIGFDADDLTYNCEHHALDFPVDILEQAESGDLENIYMEAADICAEVGALSHEKRVIDAALTAAGAGSALAITSGDDIIDQLDEVILNIIKAAKYGGLMGVGILFGAGAARVVKNHVSVKNRFVAGNKRTFAAPSMTDVAEMCLSQPETALSLLVADGAAEGLAASTDFLLNGDILVFARRANPTRRDPSFMKTFRLRNQWMKPGSYTREDGRAEVAKFDWSADVKVTNSAAVQRLTVALS